MEELNYETNEKKNMKYLELFKNKLESDGLSNSTIKEHVFNTRFYLNDYLTYYEYIPMEKGMSYICEFFSDWFIRKVMWSTPASIKSNISSLKKFYKLMVELNYASKEDYLEMLDDIKYEKDSWISACKAYNSGEEDWRRDIFKISFLLIFFFN